MPKPKIAPEQAAVIAESSEVTTGGMEHGAGGAETEVISPSQRQILAAAWSETDDSPELVEPWRRAWVLAAAILAPLAVLASIIPVTGWLIHPSRDTTCC